MSEISTALRKLGKKLSDDGFIMHILCGHCNKLTLKGPTELEEIDRINLDKHSAEVTYNLDCGRCGEPNQLKTVVEDK